MVSYISALSPREFRKKFCHPSKIVFQTENTPQLDWITISYRFIFNNFLLGPLVLVGISDDAGQYLPPYKICYQYFVDTFTSIKNLLIAVHNLKQNLCFITLCFLIHVNCQNIRIYLFIYKASILKGSDGSQRLKKNKNKTEASEKVSLSQAISHSTEIN